METPMTITNTVYSPLSSFCTVDTACLVQCCPVLVSFVCLFLWCAFQFFGGFQSEQLIILSKCALPPGQI